MLRFGISALQPGVSTAASSLLQPPTLAGVVAEIFHFHLKTLSSSLKALQRPTRPKETPWACALHRHHRAEQRKENLLLSTTDAGGCECCSWDQRKTLRDLPRSKLCKEMCQRAAAEARGAICSSIFSLIAHFIYEAAVKAECSLLHQLLWVTPNAGCFQISHYKKVFWWNPWGHLGDLHSGCLTSHTLAHGAFLQKATGVGGSHWERGELPLRTGLILFSWWAERQQQKSGRSVAELNKKSPR